MANEIFNYSVYPSVVPADTESEITVCSGSGIFGFFDDVIYDVKIIPKEESDVPKDNVMSLDGWDNNRKIYRVRPKDGKIKIKHYFSGEQEWAIRISSREYKLHLNPMYEKNSPHWDSLIHAPEGGAALSVYSLLPDLYGRRPAKGDFHIHTTGSDGSETPQRTAANYRKEGYDVIAMTEHNAFNSSAEVKKKLSFIKNFELICGEEVHNGYLGHLHIVNIGGRYSVNEIWLNEPKRIEKEAEELSKTVEVPDGIDTREYLYRLWTYREIKKSGGYAIYPHPYWGVKDHYPVETSMSMAILKYGLCDAFEVLGGCTPKENNIQLALYYELVSQGLKFPIVGSSDSHSSMPGASHFAQIYTIVFGKGDVIRSINDGYSVAVDAWKGESVRIYGSFRLVKYAHFLINNYFARRAPLCASSGLYIDRYLSGADDKELIIAAEERISEFSDKFFGNT